jgi:hypothetical protein
MLANFVVGQSLMKGGAFHGCLLRIASGSTAKSLRHRRSHDIMPDDAPNIVTKPSEASNFSTLHRKGRAREPSRARSLGTPYGLVPFIGMEDAVSSNPVGMSEGRERAVAHLAAELLFRIEKRGDRFTLERDADVGSRVRRENLTLDEVEELLETWKLRGFHGG